MVKCIDPSSVSSIQAPSSNECPLIYFDNGDNIRKNAVGGAAT